jgi:hypothetical protein
MRDAPRCHFFTMIWGLSKILVKETTCAPVALDTHKARSIPVKHIANGWAM